MNTKNFFKYLTLVAIVGILFTSCRKKQEDNDSDTSAGSDNALCEGTFNDVHSIADEASSGSLTSYMGTNNSNEKGILSSCATVTINTTVNPHTITVDFGTTNCFCNDGRYRRGVILITYSGNYRDSASTHTITFPGNTYYVNDNQALLLILLRSHYN